MGVSLSQLARDLGLELQGEDKQITGIGTLEKAGPGEVSFLANPKYLPQLEATRAAAVIVERRFADRVETALISDNPYRDFGRALGLFSRPQGSFDGVSDQASIHPEARLEDGVVVYPYVYVGPGVEIGAGTTLFPGCYVGERCRIGRDCRLYPNVTLMADTVLGDRVAIQAGAVLGSDGFGYAAAGEGREKIPQIGNVVVEDDVEIGAGTCIDRAALDSTVIGRGTKIDNLVQIGHNVTVGEESVIVAQVGISGSARVGRTVVLAGQSGISGHLSIGDDAVLGPQSGVAKDVPPGAVMGGSPVMERGAFMRYLTLVPKLPEMAKRLRRLERRMEDLQQAPTRGEKDEG